MVLAEPFPAVFLRIESEQPVWRALVSEMFCLVELDDVKRIDVRRIPIEEPAIGVVIVKELRIPWTGLHRVGFCEYAIGLGLSRHREPWEQGIVNLDATRRRLCQHENRQRGSGTWKNEDRVAHCEHSRCNDVRQR